MGDIQPSPLRAPVGTGDHAPVAACEDADRLRVILETDHAAPVRVEPGDQRSDVIAGWRILDCEFELVAHANRARTAAMTSASEPSLAITCNSRSPRWANASYIASAPDNDTSPS